MDMARERDLPLLTSDKYILRNADRLRVRVINLREIYPKELPTPSSPK